MRKVALVVTGIVVLVGAVIVPPLVLLVGLIGEAHHTCVNGAGSAYGSVAGYTGPGVAGLTEQQTSHASAVVAQGQQMGIPDEGIVVALAVVSQESGFRVYANDGEGGDLASDQQGIERSLDLPHDAVGTDHGSLGLFQQQWPWWGSMEELMDPAISAAKFYEALREVPGWEDLPLTVAAQTVQRSAYPDAYADDEDLARQLLAALGSNDFSTGAVTPVGSDADPYNLGEVTPQLRALVETLAPMFGITTVGGYRASATDMDGHPAGLAADFMVPLTPEGFEQGQALATYAQRNAASLGIDYIIWNQEIWSLARAREGWRPMEDRGSPTANHEDHPHINVLPDADPGAIGAPGAAAVPAVAGTGLTGAVPGELKELCDKILPAGATAAAGGAVVHPMPPGTEYTSQNNYGETGSSWDSYHTGTDFSAACGTPVLASHAGTVRIDTDQSWSGQWLVMVETSPGQLTTWYAHMESVTVSDGDPVTPGQQIGTVGSEGNSTGCHLHFEVHPKGGGYAEDDVDPIPWLAANVGANPVVPGGVPSGAPAGAGRLRVSSFNLHQGLGAGLAVLAREIEASGASVIALQEVNHFERSRGGLNQAEWLARRLGMQYVYAPAKATRGKRMGNAVLSKYPIVQSTVLKLPRGGGPEPRNALRTWINVNGNQVQVWATHFHFTGRGRVLQARALASAVGRPDCSTVVAGDFNFTPNMPMHRTVTRNLRDTFAGQPPQQSRTVPAQAPQIRIDYLLHSKQMGLPLVWLTHGVCGSQAASAVA